MTMLMPPFERHRVGERELKKHGIRNTMMFKCVLPWVHFLIACQLIAKQNRWTASYQLHPALGGGKTFHINDGALPMIVSPNQPQAMPCYEDKLAAVAACERTLLQLKQKLGM